jgi:hypothetical protein
MNFEKPHVHDTVSNTDSEFRFVTIAGDAFDDESLQVGAAVSAGKTLWAVKRVSRGHRF